jgi:succinyl-CoA:acetate CoA-transferase
MTAGRERLHGQVPVESATAAAERIPASATVAVSGFGRVGYPKNVPLALAERGEELSLTLLSGGSVGDEIDTTLADTGAIDRRLPYQATASLREKANDGSIAYHDRHIAGFGDEIRTGVYGPIDVAVIEAIAVGEDWLIPSTSIGHSVACIDAAETLIVEVNETQPLALRELHDAYDVGSLPDRDPIPLTAPGQRIGDPRIEFEADKLESVVETNIRDSPYSFRAPTDSDLGIAANFRQFLAEEVESRPLYDDRVTLQFGVGSLGNALMGELADADLGNRAVAYYGEVIQDGLLDLVDSGDLAVASATSLALSEEGQDRLFDNVETYSDCIVLRPAEVTNGPEVVRRLGVIAVNSALEVDVYGHVNSTHVGGTRVLNGIGGSADFNRNAVLSVVTLNSTAKDGNINRIVPMAPHVDHTEHDVDVVVTEQGVADLRGKAPRERARDLVVSCAHPEFRPDLRAYLERAADRGGHVPNVLSTAFEGRDGS